MYVKIKSKEKLLKILDETKHPDESNSVAQFLENEEQALFKTVLPFKSFSNITVVFNDYMFNYCGKIIEVKEKMMDIYKIYIFKQTGGIGARWNWQKNWVENIAKTKIEML